MANRLNATSTFRDVNCANFSLGLSVMTAGKYSVLIDPTCER